MRDYFHELNLDTRRQFLDEVQSITKDYGVLKVDFCLVEPYIDSFPERICFWFEVKMKRPLMRSIPLKTLYDYLENLGIEFNESNIDLWLSIARDYCFEEVKEIGD